MTIVIPIITMHDHYNYPTMITITTIMITQVCQARLHPCLLLGADGRDIRERGGGLPPAPATSPKSPTPPPTATAR